MLVLIVGPSGAGKDTLINAVRTQLAGDARVRFARRDVTRAASVEEENRCVSLAEFAALRDGGFYALWWEAHGLSYGIRAAEFEDAEVVVASVSRAILAEAAQRFAVRVVEITASPEVLAKRLAGRGREGAEEIALRLARQMPIPAGIEVVTILNDGAIEAAAARLRAAIAG
jgi:phosphonate metabolism protein PhnN/1,5-bisphosphokinase (PRPP-forming)